MCWNLGVLVERGMVEKKLDSLRRNLSRKRSFRGTVGGDDRGWTLLHVGARKGDLNEV